MKILKEGNLNDWEIEQRCTGAGNDEPGCNARLLVAEEDIFITTCSAYYNDDKEYYYTFKCPCCGALSDISDEDIPLSIRKRIMKRYKNGAIIL